MEMMVKNITLWILLGNLFACQLPAQQRYESRKGGDPNGIGKWYMGRQIAQVMGHFGIDWLERSEREAEEHSAQLILNMALKPGEVVADIGAGSGYHTERMAPLVAPAGKIMAVDIQQEMLDFLSKKMAQAGVKNVNPVLGSEQSTSLSPGSVDKILMVDVYHELSFPWEMGRDMWQALKPGGLLYLVEFRAEDPAVPIKEVHKMTEKQAKKELEAVGFRFVENITNLPWQHCLVFQKP